jgi:hypothetical protein
LLSLRIVAFGIPLIQAEEGWEGE